MNKPCKSSYRGSRGVRRVLSTWAARCAVRPICGRLWACVQLAQYLLHVRVFVVISRAEVRCNLKCTFICVPGLTGFKYGFRVLGH